MEQWERAGEELRRAADMHVKAESAKQRPNRDLCVARQAFLEPCKSSREAVYKQRLLQGLPWHWYRKPLMGKRNEGNAAQWLFETAAPNTPPHLRQFTMTRRYMDAATTFDNMCVAFEQTYAQYPAGLLCECCQQTGTCPSRNPWCAAKHQKAEGQQNIILKNREHMNQMRAHKDQTYY